MMTPCPIGLKYLPYQEEDIAWAKDKRAVLLGHQMGTGKTIIACGIINCHPEIESLLVVCPKTLIINWRRETEKWIISPCVDITIINYDVLRKLDMSKTYDCVIFDESHYAKSVKALRSRLCRQIKAKYRLALTGTVIPNRPVEAFHQLHLLDPTAWPISAYKKYCVRFCAAFQSKWGWDCSGHSNLPELRELLMTILKRRTKAEVLKDLPPMIHQIIELPVDGLPAELKAQLKEVTRNVEQLQTTYMGDAHKLHNAMSVAWNDMAALRHEVGLAKVVMAVELITDALESGGKLVVFAHHRDVIEELQMGLAEFFPAVIHGGTPAGQRQSAVDRFQTNPKCRVFIGNIQAGGVGITLTAASHVVFTEFDFSPGIMDQAASRCHRIGQKESVLIQYLALENSMDSLMVKALVRKQGIIDQVVG